LDIAAFLPEILSGLSLIILIVAVAMLARVFTMMREMQAGQRYQAEADTYERETLDMTANRLVRVEERLNAFKEEAARQDQMARDAMAKEMRHNREELKRELLSLSEIVRKLGADQSKQQGEFRDKLDEKMRELRAENSQKLDEMRKTVDEKLQTTLEKRLSESFKTVSERLEAVHQGLGDMQKVATGVGDLKRVLTNVKSRGVIGEVQLKMLIEDFLTPDQYIENYDCGFQTGQKRVEFGIRMPGEEPRYMPVDAKFPMEDYDRILLAEQDGDMTARDAAATALVKRVRGSAKEIAQKYFNPPHTTHDAVLFLPTEGLYAEIIKHDGLIQSLQREFSVTVAGPTIFQVLLTTFRMGYQQAVMQEHAAEVWKILGAVKKEFNTYGEQIAAMGKNVKAMEKHIEKLDVRKRGMLRALKGVEELDDASAIKLIGDGAKDAVEDIGELFDGESDT